jgi:hypothetical protein
MAKKSIDIIEKEAIDEIKAIINKPWYSFLLFWRKKDSIRGLKFALIVAILKIAIPALIAILKAINPEKFERLIQYLEQVREMIGSL